MECSDGNYANGSNCYQCTDSLPGCTSCSQDGLTCQSCNATESFVLTIEQKCECINGFHFNSSWRGCQSCSTLDALCLECEEFESSEGFAYRCNVCAVGHFQRESSCLPCTLEIAGCLQCTVNVSVSAVQCDVCDEQSFYFLDHSAEGLPTCTKCSLMGCTNCSSLSSCVSCNDSNNFFLQTENRTSCTLCSIVGCVDCSSLSECTQCD